MAAHMMVKSRFTEMLEKIVDDLHKEDTDSPLKGTSKYTIEALQALATSRLADAMEAMYTIESIAGGIEQ